MSTTKKYKYAAPLTKSDVNPSVKRNFTLSEMNESRNKSDSHKEAVAAAVGNSPNVKRAVKIKEDEEYMNKSVGERLPSTGHGIQSYDPIFDIASMGAGKGLKTVAKAMVRGAEVIKTAKELDEISKYGRKKVKYE